MWSVAVFARGPSAQHSGQGFPGPRFTVVTKREQRMKPEAALERGPGQLLLAVCGHQGGVQVDGDLASDPSGQRTPTCPDPLPGCGPCGTDPLDRGLDIRGESGDQPRHRRVRGHRPKQLRLCADHRDIGCTVAAERDRGPEVQEHLARVMSRPIRAPRPQRPRQLPLDTRDPHSPLHKESARGADQLLAGRVQTNTSNPDTLHLRSAFRSEPLRRRNPKSPVPDRHFRALRAVLNPHDVKARG
jgi:hypothetical protein